MSHLSIIHDTPAKKNHIDNILENALQREKKLLQTALKRTKDNLRKFEQQYQMSSDKFFELYQAGKTDDRDDYVDWAGEYHIYLSIKEKVQDVEELTIEYS
ncbi:hypothetical protein JW964_02845 [candidate division KSB1 bacterium]|nr:hypothetical protein [candidate division KSB1 bacterium]